MLSASISALNPAAWGLCSLTPVSYRSRHGAPVYTFKVWLRV